MSISPIGSTDRMDSYQSAPGSDESLELHTDDLAGLSPEAVRVRAMTALRQRRFDLADQLLARGDLERDALIENLRIYQAELEIQNEELLLGQRQVQEGLARFTSLFNTLPIAELVVDRKGLIREANPAAQDLFGLQTSRIHQRFFFRLIEEHDRATVIGAWSTLTTTQSLVLTDIGFRAEQDGDFIGDLHVASLPGGEPHDQHYVCAVVDRTQEVVQRRSVFETGVQLRRSEAELRERLKELATLHAVLIQTSQFGRPVEQVLNSIVACLPLGCTHPERVAARIRFPEITVAGAGFVETAWSLSLPIRHAGARVGDVTLAYRNTPPEEGMDTPFAPERCLLDSVATQLSVYLARLDDEERLRQSRERYRVLAEFSSDWEYWLGPDGDYIYVSPACMRVCGYPAEAFMTDPDFFERLIIPSDRGIWAAHIKALHTNQATDLEPLELRIHARCGVEHWIEHICNPVMGEDGSFLGRRGVNRDITQRKHFEEALLRSEAFLSTTGRMAKVGGWEYDPSTKHIRWTKGLFDTLDIAFETPPKLDDLLLRFHPEDREALNDAIRQAVSQGRQFDMDVRLGGNHDQPTWLQITCEPLMQDATVIKLIGAVQDVTARVAAERSLRQAACVFENTAEGVIIVNPLGRILAVNHAFTEITGYAEHEVLGKSSCLMRSERYDESFCHTMREELTTNGRWRGETWNRHKDGHDYPTLLTISAVVDIIGDPTQYVEVFSDISQLKHSEERLEYLAHHDSLTGLPNRSLFKTRLEHCLQRAKRYRRQVGLLFLDLDRFKEVNDTLGHAVGDALLVEVARVLATQVREVDTIARLGGDEFVVILEDIPAPRFAATFAERLVETFAKPLDVQGRTLFITASIGISVYPIDGEDIDALVKHADIAMYQTKNNGRNGFSFFEQAMSDGAVERLRLEQDLRSAIERDELLLHYQPQLSLNGCHLRGVEALCRWHHPRLGLIAPDVFIPIAEEIGLMDELGFWVLDQSCRQLAHWDQAGLRVPRMAVNLSVREIERPGLAERVASTLARFSIAAERLELEVSESKIMRRADDAIGVLHALRELGVTLAIDDFGTGYSSLAYLKRFPLNRLKIDRSFTDKLTLDPNDDAIVRAIIVLAHTLGLEVLAEGVETQAQADFLQGEGCCEGQGYLFSRPISHSELHTYWPHAI